MFFEAISAAQKSEEKHVILAGREKIKQYYWNKKQKRNYWDICRKGKG